MNYEEFLQIFLHWYYYIIFPIKKKKKRRGAWVAQSVKHPTLDLSSDLNFRVLSSSPILGNL